jgi:hypothetical protein
LNSLFLDTFNVDVGAYAVRSYSIGRVSLSGEKLLYFSFSLFFALDSLEGTVLSQQNKQVKDLYSNEGLIVPKSKKRKRESHPFRERTLSV